MYVKWRLLFRPSAEVVHPVYRQQRSRFLTFVRPSARINYRSLRTRDEYRNRIEHMNTLDIYGSPSIFPPWFSQYLSVGSTALTFLGSRNADPEDIIRKMSFPTINSSPALWSPTRESISLDLLATCVCSILDPSTNPDYFDHSSDTPPALL